MRPAINTIFVTKGISPNTDLLLYIIITKYHRSTRARLSKLPFTGVFSNYVSNSNICYIYSSPGMMSAMLLCLWKTFRSYTSVCSPQRSLARLLQAGGRTAAGTAPGRTFMSDSRSVSPVPKAIRSKAAAPSPAGRTRPGASSAPCVKVGDI